MAYTARSLLASLLVLTSCATTSYQSTLSTWIGHKVDDVVVAWGPPERTYALAEGGRVMEWTEDRGSRAIATPGITTTTQYTCSIRVTSSAAGVVQRVSLEGNSC